MKESFHFLKTEDDITYIESYGVDFEDFEPGQVFEHRPGRTLTDADNMEHALRALDLSPHYADRNYARALHNDRLPVTEPYILGLLAMTTKTFGKVVANLGMLNIEIRPVYVGDTLYLESEILNKRVSASRPDQGILHIATRGYNQKKEPVLSFERKLLLYRRGAQP